MSDLVKTDGAVTAAGSSAVLVLVGIPIAFFFGFLDLQKHLRILIFHGPVKRRARKLRQLIEAGMITALEVRYDMLAKGREALPPTLYVQGPHYAFSVGEGGNLHKKSVRTKVPKKVRRLFSRYGSDIQKLVLPILHTALRSLSKEERLAFIKKGFEEVQLTQGFRFGYTWAQKEKPLS